MGLCSKAASPWASPLHMTPKKDCTWRPCGDYRRLNLIKKPDHYAEHLRFDIQHWYILCFLQTGCFEGLLPSASQPGRCFHQQLSPLPLEHMCSITQHSGHSTESDLSGNGEPDIWPSSFLQSLHRQHHGIIRKPQRSSRAHAVCTRTTSQERPPYQKRQMCLWSINVRISRYAISGDGIRPLSSKVDAVNRFPKTTTVKQLQEFLGMINYYYRCILNAVGILTPLYLLISTKANI